jgi:hypothetical protein
MEGPKGRAWRATRAMLRKHHLRAMKRALRFWDQAPANALRTLVWLALVPRLVAAFLSPGYFAHDDHFLIAEAAGSWSDGFDFDHWLPWNQGPDAQPSGHSFFYVGLHYLLFVALKAMGLTDPKALMTVVRLLHALWSLVTVRMGYRIAARLSDPLTAWRTGLLLALLCYMPFLSVRNLVEVACIPLLMLGAWQLVRGEGGPTVREAALAGLWIGLAMNVRFQTIFFAAGPGLALLLQRKWRPMLAYGLAVFIPLAVIQGAIDLVLWGRPWAEVTQYVRFNLTHTTDYGVLPWYNYLLLLAGLFIPPFSLAVLFGFFRRPRPLALWLPVFLFLAIHSWFPNKQERFMLPIVPLFLVLGFTGWEAWRSRSGWWQRHEGLWRGTVAGLWALNLVLLPMLTATYSKRSRVEALYALRSERPLNGLIVEDGEEDDPPMPPLFYLGQWDMGVFPWGLAHAHDDLRSYLTERGLDGRTHHVLFIGTGALPARMERLARSYGPIEVIGAAQPGFVDRVVHWLNPVNRNETIILARIRDKQNRTP